MQLRRITCQGIRALSVVIACAFLATVLFQTPILEAASINKLKSALTKSIKKKDYAAVREIYEHLGASGDKKAASVIVQSLTALPLHEVVDSAIDALVSLGSENIASVFDKLLKKKRPHEDLFAVIVHVANKIDDEKSEGWLLTALEKGNNFHYRNAVPALVERKSRNAIPALIDLLERVGYHSSNESYLVRDALLHLTAGEDFKSIPDWRNWWEINKDSWDPKNPGKETGGLTGVDRKWTPDGKKYKAPEFFGLPVLSHRIAFVIDVSGSMRLWDKDGVAVGDGPEWKIKQRLVRVKAQLKKTIEEMPATAQFSIIAYSGPLKFFNEKGPMPATARVKKKALEWVEGLRPEGATHTDDAMAAAFKQGDLDTIVLLSDGAPSKETSDKTPLELIPEVLELVRKLNLLPKIKIHTFGFEGDGEVPPGTAKAPPPPANAPKQATPEDLKEFLTKMAETSGGTYTAVK